MKEEYKSLIIFCEDISEFMEDNFYSTSSTDFYDQKFKLKKPITLTNFKKKILKKKVNFRYKTKQGFIVLKGSFKDGVCKFTEFNYRSNS